MTKLIGSKMPSSTPLQKGSIEQLTLAVHHRLPSSPMQSVTIFEGCLSLFILQSYTLFLGNILEAFFISFHSFSEA